MEYNPGVYTALAVGKIDYGFRDFLGRNTRQKGQNFLMGRIGLGNIEKKAIIFQLLQVEDIPMAASCLILFPIT
ncbi:hypothetical protein [Paraflavitalea speifideaquila]|uniref:hypothetical protein n=1 Tax=Paraflavitalea speifideaquila TaxID=3076558 RepID=UPI0028EC0C5D|nr:hypothetical protein [Paraflavitalea speifideiaquila]